MLNSTREKYLAIIAAVCLLAAVGWESCSGSGVPAAGRTRTGIAGRRNSCRKRQF